MDDPTLRRVVDKPCFFKSFYEFTLSAFPPAHLFEHWDWYFFDTAVLGVGADRAEKKMEIAQALDLVGRTYGHGEQQNLGMVLECRIGFIPNCHSSRSGDDGCVAYIGGESNDDPRLDVVEVPAHVLVFDLVVVADDAGPRVLHGPEL